MCHCLPARQHASTVCRMSEIHARAFKNRVASHTVLHHLRRTNLRVLNNVKRGLSAFSCALLDLALRNHVA